MYFHSFRNNLFTSRRLKEPTTNSKSQLLKNSQRRALQENRLNSSSRKWTSWRIGNTSSTRERPWMELQINPSQRTNQEIKMETVSKELQKLMAQDPTTGMSIEDSTTILGEVAITITRTREVADTDTSTLARTSGSKTPTTTTINSQLSTKRTRTSSMPKEVTTNPEKAISSTKWVQAALTLPRKWDSTKDKRKRNEILKFEN